MEQAGTVTPNALRVRRAGGLDAHDGAVIDRHHNVAPPAVGRGTVSKVHLLATASAAYVSGCIC